MLEWFGLAAVAICALPMVADSFGAVPPAPAFEINRGIKTDRLVMPNVTVARRKVPTETVREAPRPDPAQTKQKLLDGCEPAFSSVTMPSMAHISSRCVG